MATITGIAFEEYVWDTWWLRNFPTSEWSCHWGKSLAGGFKVDFVAYQGNDRAIGDAKDKATVTFQDIDKLLEDAGIYKARWLYVLIAADTRVPSNVRIYAEDNGVEIIRTRWRA